MIHLTLDCKYYLAFGVTSVGTVDFFFALAMPVLVHRNLLSDL